MLLRGTPGATKASGGGARWRGVAAHGKSSRVSARTPPLAPRPHNAALPCERIETDPPPLPPPPQKAASLL